MFNYRGTTTLLYRETLRFLHIIVQTLLVPVLTSVLYLVVFSYLLEGRVTMYEGISYAAFLVPGLMMMSIIQNASASAASSILLSKIMGNLTFMLMAPLSSLELFIGFVGAAIIRGLMVSFSIYLVAIYFADVTVHHVFLLVFMAFLCSLLMGALGLLAGLWAEGFEQLSLFQNFFILPLSFLSGVFYSIHKLPEFWQQLSHYNPFFYMIDGLRYAFLGQSDVSPITSVLVVLVFTLLTSTICLLFLNKGYKIRN